MSLWCGVRMHLTVTKQEYFYQFSVESKVVYFMHGLSNCMNRIFRVVLIGTMVTAFCMGVVGIVLLRLCLRSVDRILCLFHATFFLCAVSFLHVSLHVDTLRTNH